MEQVLSSLSPPRLDVHKKADTFLENVGFFMSLFSNYFLSSSFTSPAANANSFFTVSP